MTEKVYIEKNDLNHSNEADTSKTNLRGKQQREDEKLDKE